MDFSCIDGIFPFLSINFSLALPLTKEAAASAPKDFSLELPLTKEIAAPTPKDINGFTVKQLKDELRRHGQRLGGNRAELLARLQNYIKDAPKSAVKLRYHETHLISFMVVIVKKLPAETLFTSHPIQMRISF